MPHKFLFLCLFSYAPPHLECPPPIQTFFIFNSEALTHLLPESLPAHVSPMNPLFLIFNITPHQSLITEAMLRLFHCYLPYCWSGPSSCLGCSSRVFDFFCIPEMQSRADHTKHIPHIYLITSLKISLCPNFLLSIWGMEMVWKIPVWECSA